MSVHAFHRPGATTRRRRPLDPRRALAVVLALSLAGLGTLPRVAKALGGVSVPPLTRVLGDEDFQCRVVEIVDGDTVTLDCPGRPAERARLMGFDTPELFSPKCASERVSAAQAKVHLAGLIRGADRLGVVRRGHDRYGRALVMLSIDERPVADEMIAAGLARAYDGGRRGGWCGAEMAALPERGMAARWPGRGERGTSAKWVRVGG